LVGTGILAQELEYSTRLCYEVTHKEAVPFMEWTAETIRQLRTNAQITQAQLAGWLGVTVKQVKHLENRRRNPSGPVERLLDIFAKQHNGQPVQILSAPRRDHPEPRVVEPAGNDALVWDH
jgi:DNA-binding transcriptional regulator YiaG